MIALERGGERGGGGGVCILTKEKKEGEGAKESC
jgi:hypothetical protein